MRHTLSLALVALLLVLSGCAKDRRSDDDDAARGGPSLPPPPDTSKPISVTGVDWVLTRLGSEASLPAEPAKARPWFHLDGGERRRATGNTGVNILNGGYELS